MIGLQEDFLAKPVAAGKFSPRSYQSRAIEAIDRELLAHRSTLWVAATGVGKTVVFCMQALRRGGCLVIAHRDSLIRQAAEKLELATGEPIAIEKAQERAHFGAKFIVGSVQTIKGPRLIRFANRFPHLEFIIIDEAHRATAKSYRDILAAFPKALVLGVTATPDRSDEVGLKAVFDTVADTYDILDATADGWLTPLRFVPVHSEVNLDGIKVTRQSDGEKDFDQAQLDDAILQEAGRISRAVLDAVASHGTPEDRLLVFTPGVKTAHAVADALNDLRPGSAGAVDGSMDDAEKRPIIEAHRRGEIKYLTNCAVFTEGYDDAKLTGVFDAAPTKSRLRAMQKWGRATRLWPEGIDHHGDAAVRRSAISQSPKPWAVIYDLVANSSKHDVVGPLDLLAGKDLNTKVRDEAKKILKEKGGSVAEAVDEAKKLLRARAAARRMAASAKVTVGTPRSIFDRAGLKWISHKEKLAQRPEDKASPAMLWKLNERHIPIPPNCSKRMFRRLLVTDQKREGRGMCRLAGVEWLRQFGVDGWSMTTSQALRIKEAIIANGRQALTPAQLSDAIERVPGEDDV